MNDFRETLESYRVNKGDEYTHTSASKKFKGSFYVPDKQYKKFLDTYVDALEEKREKGITLTYGITEKQMKFSSVIIDVDYRQKKGDRQYTGKHVRRLINVYMSNLTKYFGASNYRIFVFEKDEPTYDDKNKNYKDGFHIIITCYLSLKNRKFLYEQCLKDLKKKDIFGDLNILNLDYGQLLDAGPIDCVWMLYKSSRNGTYYYKCKQIYDVVDEHDITDITKKYNLRKLVHEIALRYDRSDEVWELLDEYQDDMDKFVKNSVNKGKAKQVKGKKKVARDSDDEDDEDEEDEEGEEDEDEDDEEDGKKKGKKLYTKKQKKEKENKEKTQKSLDQMKENLENVKALSDLSMARELLGIISRKRAGNYHDWFHIGCVLYNIDSVNLLDDWIKWSQIKRYCDEAEDACTDHWENKFENRGITLGSLFWLAKNDDPVKFEEFQKKIIRNKIKTTGASYNDTDIAELLFHLYRDTFVCTNIQKRQWMMYENHRWVPNENGHTLEMKITQIVRPIIMQSILECHDKSQLDKSYKEMSSFAKTLVDMGNQKRIKDIIDRARSYFYRKDFFDQLDSGTKLIGFTNGVFDLEARKLRPGKPDDMISFSTGYDYVEYNMSHKKVKYIIDLLKQIQPDKDVREFLLKWISSWFDGHIYDQKFTIFTGSGRNGKSTLIKLIEATWGKKKGGYYSTVDATMFTREADNPSKPKPHLANKKYYKRVLTCGEPEAHDKLKAGIIKIHTGGDSFEVRGCFETESITIDPQYSVVMITNNIPEIDIRGGDYDDGIWRRILVIHFPSKFLEKTNKMYNPKNKYHFVIDKNVNKTIESYKDVFAWLLLNIYYPMFMDGGDLNVPEEVEKHTKKYQDECNDVGNFISHTYTVTGEKEDKVKFKDVYDKYRIWSASNFKKYKVTDLEKELAHNFRNIGVKVEKNNLGLYVYAGLKLKKDDDEDEDD